MKREMDVLNHPKPGVLRGWAGTALLLLLLAGAVYLCFYSSVVCLAIDGCGPYHHTTSVADLDGDSDPDVLLSGLRHETETIIWAGSTLWTNQGGGVFTPRNFEYGGSSAATGDVDGDGDADVVRLDYRASLFFNQGGEQGGKTGDFTQGPSIAPKENLHNWSAPGWVVFADLNNDRRLDVLVSYCCSMLIDKKAGDFTFLEFPAGVWINPQNSRNLTSLGDLPMRPALGDLDGDGDLDVFAASLPPKGADYDASDRVLLNDGSGSLVDSGQRLHNARLAGAAGSGAAALGDLDGDGDLDVLAATADGAAAWTNQGGAQGGQAGLFVASGQRLGREPSRTSSWSDLDSDGDLDALVAGKEQASIWLNDGQAVFRDSGQRLGYTERHGLAVDDFNADGYPDVFSAAGERVPPLAQPGRWAAAGCKVAFCQPTGRASRGSPGSIPTTLWVSIKP